MRCFIAINFPEEVKDRIKNIQNQLPEFFGKKTEKENIHLTLKFLGEISEEKVNEVKERLKNISSERFDARINSLGVFSEDYVRIVWLHMNGAENLHEEVDEKLSDVFERERRFIGHITIARVKNLNDKKDFLERLKNMKIEEINFRVNEFYLMKSELAERGPTYEIIEKFILR